MTLLFQVLTTVSLLNSIFVRCWKFDILGINETKVELARIAIYNLRGFVAIPRVYDDQPFTVVEIPWPERSIYTIYDTKPFPNSESQKIGDCTQLQSAVSLEIDKKKGHLYVLDNGLKNQCTPKLVVYDVNTNKRIMQTQLKGVSGENLRALVIDSNSQNQNVRVIIGDAGNNSLLVYDSDENIWRRLTITSNFVSQTVKDEFAVFNFNQLALSQKTSTLFATFSQATELYSINMDEFKNIEKPLPTDRNLFDYDEAEITVRYIGHKFGKSSALFANIVGNLFYIYERDDVILKWNPRTSFVAENTEVILQNNSLIANAVQIFAEPPSQMWVLNSKRNEYSSFIVKLKNPKIQLSLN